jgi:hypothetical protein
MIDVETNSRIYNGGVVKNTLFWKLLERNKLKIPRPKTMPGTNEKYPYAFVADEAFQLNEHFMRPYRNKYLNDNRRIFNYRLSCARRVVENAFGILVTKFGVLQKAINLESGKVKKIVLACCYLHNYVLKH